MNSRGFGVGTVGPRSPWGGGQDDLQRLVDDFAQPNGLCFSPDESLLYINDPATTTSFRQWVVRLSRPVRAERRRPSKRR